MFGKSPSQSRNNRKSANAGSQNTPKRRSPAAVLASVFGSRSRRTTAAAAAKRRRREQLRLEPLEQRQLMTTIGFGDPIDAVEGGAVQFPVQPSGELDHAVTVWYETFGQGTAVEASTQPYPAHFDYYRKTGSLTFPAGPVVPQIISVNALDDNLDEPPPNGDPGEWFSIRLTETDDPNIPVDPTTGGTFGYIIDNDSPPTVTIAATDPTAVEPPAQDLGAFTITRSGDVGSVIQVFFTLDGQAGVDDYAAIIPWGGDIPFDPTDSQT